jgi:PAS domain S-box-containing protein
MEGRDERHSLDATAGLRLLIDHSTDMLARHALDGTYLYVSPACRRLLGYAPEELVGRSAYAFIHPDDEPAVRHSHAQVLADPRVRAVTYRIADAHGRYVWFETTAHTVRHPDTGEVIEILTSSRDVTQRRVAEAALRASEQRFRLAMANAPIGMALVGLGGEFVEVNDRLCGLLGRSRDELTALSFQEVTHPDDLEKDLELAGRLIAGEIQQYEMEKRYLRPSGEIVWALLSGSLVRDDGGDPLHFIAQVVDIGDQRRAMEGLERASDRFRRSNAELERYAAVAAHELRGPLATVGQFLEALRRRAGTPTDEQTDGLVRLAQEVVGQMADSVESLLSLSRIDVDDLIPELVDVGEIVDEALVSLGPSLEAADPDLRIGALPRVLADRSQLRLLFRNLFDNAVRFRDPARRLVLSVAAVAEPEGWRFVIRDNGRGLDPADRERIFEPFARARSGPDGLGTSGIGLATCRMIAERHGGSIAVEPQQPGARFELTLPTELPPPGDYESRGQP